MRCSASRAAAAGRSAQLEATRRASESLLGSGSPGIGAVTMGGGGREVALAGGGVAGAVDPTLALAAGRGTCFVPVVGGAGGAPPHAYRPSTTSKGRPT